METREAGPSCRKLEIEQVMPGAVVIHAGGEQIALGFPEEVVKAWLNAKKSPTAWIVPDLRTAEGVVQWALEFPLYFSLFVQGNFAKGKKLSVLVQRRDWPDVVDYLRLTLLGLTASEFKAAGVKSSIAQMLLREGAHLALKDAKGKVAGIEDFLEPHFFDSEGTVQFGDLKVRSHGDNTYSFFTAQDRLEEYRLALDAPQLPPYSKPLPGQSVPNVPQHFEVTTLGTSNGFDPTGPCSNMLVQCHGQFMLVDCGPYIGTLLGQAGVSPQQIQAVVISHAHEDHAVGLNALMLSTHRIKLFTSPETAAILRRKLAIVNHHLSHPQTLLDDAFELICVEPGQTYNALGLGMRFFYTMHSIPCTGVELSICDAGTDKKALIVGDNNSRENIQKAADMGVLTAQRAAQLQQLYAWRGDLLIADAGAGLIHGMPADFRENPSRDVVYVHTGQIEPPQQHLYTLAQPGHRYTLASEKTRPTPLERSLAQQALTAAFAVQDPEFIQTLLNASTPVSVNRDHVVVRHNDTTTDLFVVLSGQLAVVAQKKGAPTQVATIHAGEIFGEMAIINNAPRSASVLAQTPTRLLRISGEVFRRAAQAKKLFQALPKLWQKRSELETVGIFADTSVTSRNDLAWRSVRRTIEPGSTLIREGSRSDTVFVLVRGRVQVYKGSSPLLVNGTPIIVNPGSLLGETAPFLRQARNASIVAIDECQVLAIRGAEFKRIVTDSPQLFCCISQVVRERQAA